MEQLEISRWRLYTVPRAAQGLLTIVIDRGLNHEPDYFHISKVLAIEMLAKGPEPVTMVHLLYLNENFKARRALWKLEPTDAATMIRFLEQSTAV